jgi:chorismate mutase
MKADVLGALRSRFDAIDDQLVALIVERARLADEAGAIKKSMGLAVRDLAREETSALRRRGRAEALIGDDSLGPLVDEVFAALVAASRARQER